MLTISASLTDSASAHELLTEYFQSRELGFAHQNVVYTITFPDPGAFIPPAGVFVIASDGDRPVGCGGIRRLEVAEGVRYELKHLYLRPEARGRGWGRAVVEDLEARARSFGATEIVLDTHHSLEAAGGLYSSMGYRLIEPYNDNPNATRWYRKVFPLDA